MIDSARFILILLHVVSAHVDDLTYFLELRISYFYWVIGRILAFYACLQEQFWTL